MQSTLSGSSEQALSDLEIARRIASGDRDQLRCLMRRHNQRLYRTARSILRDDAEAEDAVQESYLSAFRAMASFEGNATLATWLTRIVVNEAIGRARKSRRRAELITLDGAREHVSDTDEADMTEAASEQPEHAVLRRETRRLIEAGIDRLPDAFRTVFVLRAVEELTVEETAASLGIPAATVRSRYFRAKGMLRESLAREMDTSLEAAFAFAGDRCDRIVAGVCARLDELPASSSGPTAEPI
jgi:RNA polymerase sigma-70 factor, ECF subfamily